MGFKQNEMGALDDAVRDGLLKSNPANYLEFPTAKKFSGQAYTVEQLSTHLRGANEVGEPLMAARILAENVSQKQIQEFLGHEDVSTTLNIYTHIHRKDRDETADRMNQKLDSAEFCSAFCSASGMNGER